MTRADLAFWSAFFTSDEFKFTGAVNGGPRAEIFFRAAFWGWINIGVFDRSKPLATAGISTRRMAELDGDCIR